MFNQGKITDNLINPIKTRNEISQALFNDALSLYAADPSSQLIDFWHIIANIYIPSSLNSALHTTRLTNNQDKDHTDNAKKEYFNKNVLPNDLSGNVFFAQGSIIPSRIEIDGDQHPTLVSERKTLVMFKPHEVIGEQETIQLNLYDKNNNLLTTEQLLPPSKLPKIANNSMLETNLLPEDFKQPTDFCLVIKIDHQLKNVVINPNYLHHLILKNENINIILDENYTEKPFLLNYNPEYNGKQIVLDNKTDSNINIQYGNKQLSLSKNKSIHFICDKNGHWLTKDDAKLANYYRPPVSTSESNLPSTFDLEMNEDYTLGFIDSNNMDAILYNYNTVKISTTDNNWIENFHLKQNTAHTTKKLLFTSESNRSSFIHLADQVIELNQGGILLLVCDNNGSWKNLQIVEHLSTIDYTQPEEFDLVIDTNQDIRKVSNDNKKLSTLIKNNHALKIATSDGNWASNFTLEADESFAHKKILFTSESSFNSYIHYGNKQLKIETGESVFFVYHPTKKWVPINKSIPEEGIENLEYIENTWSVSIAKEYIHPDITFEFMVNQRKVILADVKIGAPNQLLIHTLDIGMLTPPRNEFDFQDSPELNRQYYQTIPVKDLIVSRYEPVYLTEVVMPDGQIFTDSATGEGGGHSGNMRRIIGKDLYSDGINLANYGVNSSKADSPAFLPTSQVTIHNSIGIYENGIQVHGWSGGGGKATLYNSKGNELSHELGHNYGLSDYYGGSEGGTHATPDKKNSTWLWDADNNYFIPNINEKGTPNTDAMSSGEPYDSRYNAYTAYTPYSLVSIQNKLECGLIFSLESTTGYKKWHPETKQMEDARVDISSFYHLDMAATNSSDIKAYQLTELLRKSKLINISSGNGYHSPNIYIPSAAEDNQGSIITIKSYANWDSNIYINNGIDIIKQDQVICYISDGVTWQPTTENKIYKKPSKQGVPVVTLLGFYDPEGSMKSYIYPALYGSYGMIYKPYKPISIGSSYLEVEFEDGKTNKYSLNGFRAEENLMNKFHINIERGLNPIKTSLFIENKKVYSRKIEIKENRLPTTINGLYL